MTWVIIFCSFLGLFCLMVGVLAGMAWEGHCAERDQEQEEREEAQARRTHPVYRQPPPPGPAPLIGTAMAESIREAGRRAWAIQQQRAGETLGEEWDRIHPGWRTQTVTSAIYETDEEFSARMSAVADEIIAWAHAASDPGSTG